jgi:hypothetical protein
VGTLERRLPAAHIATIRIAAEAAMTANERRVASFARKAVPIVRTFARSKADADPAEARRAAETAEAT